ncbi:DUF4362 domain-containing protein [Lachnoclostridium phytofermentans]|uniref:Uncharacterized protein n=1 Tax=Lachnoclostridium phytofermentans (strain ATCC 700394 / DSM 18823 / ISDg) TaxID=357809 RepID=A9KMN4_LACP7|nr:DUF4362 domain-containing protein [Lachnoclostridium phytofermentans]ABX41479.1 hypothetical protein Cphy_1101 [Lachnoclostridium phytofermentans ISDg]
MDITQYINFAEQYLRSLPRDYTPGMALENNDILYDGYARTYNLDKLLEFINNVNSGIPDFVTVTTFGMDGPAVTSVLQFNRNQIIYTLDMTRSPLEDKIITIVGNRIDVHTQNMYGTLVTFYDLIDINNNSTNIIKNVQR